VGYGPEAESRFSECFTWNITRTLIAAQNTPALRKIFIHYAGATPPQPKIKAIIAILG